MLYTVELVTMAINGTMEVGDRFESDGGVVFLNTEGMLTWEDRDESPFEVVSGDNLKWTKVED